MSATCVTISEPHEIEELKRAIEEIVSGHRQKPVLAALDRVRTEVLKAPVYKRDIDI